MLVKAQENTKGYNMKRIQLTENIAWGTLAKYVVYLYTQEYEIRSHVYKRHESFSFIHFFGSQQKLYVLEAFLCVFF